MNVTTGIVLAAGEGTRMRPLTDNRPKTMLPAADRPVLEHVLDVLVDCGLERICLVVEPAVDEYVQHVLENGSVGRREHRLRAVVRQRPHPRPLAGRQHDPRRDVHTRR